MALALSGCTAMFNSSSYGTNDLYRTNNRAEVAAQLKAEAEAERPRLRCAGHSGRHVPRRHMPLLPRLSTMLR